MHFCKGEGNLKVEEDDSVAQQEIVELAKRCLFLPLDQYAQNRNRLVDFTSRCVARELESGASAISARTSDGELLLLVTYSKLDWDSLHFQIPMWNIGHVLGDQQDRNLAEAKRKAVAKILGRVEERSHISARIDVRDIGTVHALEANGFRLMDTIITFAFNFRICQIPQLEDRCSLRLATSDDEEALLRIAATSFSNARVSGDRFHADPDLPTDKSDTLYVEWVRNSLEGKSADAVIVAEMGGKPVGFVTLQHSRAKKEELGMDVEVLVLSAVEPRCRGQNVYTSMIRKALQYFSSTADIVEGGTQVTNLPVQKALTRLGFTRSHGMYSLALSKRVV